MNVETANPAQARIQLLLILVIALASLGGAYALFYLGSGGRPWATSNHGSFVEPPLTVADLDVRRSAGEAFVAGGTWWLWVVPGGPCDDACDAALHQVRQVHVLLNRDAHRLRRALVADPPNLDRETLLARYPRLEVLSGDVGPLERGIYLIDPLGNLVLSYALADAGEPVLDDLKRLLKVSQIG